MFNSGMLARMTEAINRLANDYGGLQPERPGQPTKFRVDIGRSGLIVVQNDRFTVPPNTPAAGVLNKARLQVQQPDLSSEGTLSYISLATGDQVRVTGEQLTALRIANEQVLDIEIRLTLIQLKLIKDAGNEHVRLTNEGVDALIMWRLASRVQ